MFVELFEQFRQNVYPGPLQNFCESLGLKTSDPLMKLGIGFDPKDGCWVFPERDTAGTVIGLSRRYPNGKKYMVKGSERGFYYAVNPGFFSGKRKYNTASMNLVPVYRLQINCPVCDKPDWCMVSEDGAVCRCNRVKSTDPQGFGWLHILDETKYQKMSSGPLLYENDKPYIIVEGMSDWTAATEMGFIAVGRPGAKGKEAELLDLVRDKDVIILGENDSGAGIEGMERVFSAINKDCNAIKLMPPPDVKDLRCWYTELGITASDIILKAMESGDNKVDDAILSSDKPLDVSIAWLKREYTTSGLITLRRYKQNWYEFRSGLYQQLEDEELRGRAYRFLENKCSVRTDKKGGVSHIPINPTRAMVSDILDAMNARCLITKDPPLWLRWTGKSDPSELIAFKNGILDTKKYLSGVDDYFYPATPEFFTLTSIPHIFSPDTQLDPEIQDKLIEILVDEDKILLLQEWAGYLLMASQKYEKMMLFVGPKRAGKGTLLDLLSAMVGTGQVASTSFRSLSGSFGYSTLVGKLLAIMPDASIPREVDGVQVLETIKQITGGDGVNINRKYRDEIPFVKLVSRFIIAVNTLPELPDYAKTLESRLNIIRFTESFEGREDRNLKQRLSGKANTIIPWALEGLKRLQEQGAFTVPVSSGATMNEFISISSPLGDFISETCRLKEGIFLNRNQLYDCWLGWASREGQRKISHPTFRQRFLSLYLGGVKGETRMVEGHKVIGYTGIQITKAAKREFLEML